MITGNRMLTVAMAALILAGGAANATETTIRIDAARECAKVSPRLFGIFFEDIRHGVERGLYATAFVWETDKSLPYGFVVAQRGSVWTMGPDLANPLHPNTLRSYTLEGAEVPMRERVGITSDGFCVHPNSGADRGAHKQTASLDFSGIVNVEPQAKLTVLTSGSLRDNNSLDKFGWIVPADIALPQPGLTFNHTFPSHSLTVMRLKARRKC